MRSRRSGDRGLQGTGACHQALRRPRGACQRPDRCKAQMRAQSQRVLLCFSPCVCCATNHGACSCRKAQDAGDDTCAPPLLLLAPLLLAPLLLLAQSPCLRRLQEYREKVRANAQLAESGQGPAGSSHRSIGAAEGPSMDAFLHQLGSKVRRQVLASLHVGPRGRTCCQEAASALH